MVKNLPAHTGAAGDAGLMAGSGRFPGGEMATHSSILARKIPRTEEPRELQSMGSQRVRYDRTHTKKTYMIKPNLLRKHYFCSLHVSAETFSKGVDAIFWWPVF